MRHLPVGWAECTLHDVGEIVTGNTPFKGNVENYGDKYPWVKPPDLGSDTPITTTAEKLSEEGAQRARLIPSGASLVSCIGIIGKVGLSGATLATNQQINSVVFDSSLVIPQYGFYYCKTLKPWLDENSSSTTVAIINKRRFSEAPFILAPRNEQHRIVAKLEKLLARVNAAEERLATITSLLKRFRQSVLAAACSGNLTAAWREENRSNESALDFVQRIHIERMQRNEISPTQSSTSGVQKSKKSSNNGFIASGDDDQKNLLLGWCVTRIGDICDCLDRLRVPINKDERLRRHGCVPYYGANGQVGNIDDYIFDENLVLVVEDETFIGREKPFSYVIKGKSWVNNHAHVLRPLGGMSAEFLNILLSYYDFTPLTSGTTGRRKLNQEALLNAPIRLPPFNEQHEIVRQVEALFKSADVLETRYLKVTAHVDKLTQSVLAKAFRGELVPQDPNDEPASVLLERIKAERNGSAVGLRSRR